MCLGSARVCVQVCKCSQALYGCVQVYAGMHGCVPVCVQVCAGGGCTRLYPVVRGCTWVYTGVHWFEWVYVGVCTCVHGCVCDEFSEYLLET